MATLGSPTGGALTAANAAEDDKFPVVDTSVGASNSANKYMTAAQLRFLMQEAVVFANGNKSGSATLDFANGVHQSMTISANITALTVSNWPASGLLGKLTLEITNGGSFTMALPTGCKTAAAAGYTPTPSGSDTIILTTIDGGTTSKLYIAGQAFA